PDWTVLWVYNRSIRDGRRKVQGLGAGGLQNALSVALMTVATAQAATLAPVSMQDLMSGAVPADEERLRPVGALAVQCLTARAKARDHRGDVLSACALRELELRFHGAGREPRECQSPEVGRVLLVRDVDAGERTVRIACRQILQVLDERCHVFRRVDINGERRASIELVGMRHVPGIDPVMRNRRECL